MLKCLAVLGYKYSVDEALEIMANIYHVPLSFEWIRASVNNEALATGFNK